VGLHSVTAGISVQEVAAPGRVLLVIPSYRDAERLAVELPRLAAQLHQARHPVDVLVVDDGSGRTESEQTRAVVEKARNETPIGSTVTICETLCLPQNIGKGGAVYAGWSKAISRHEWLGFVDADGATPATEVSRLLAMALDQKSPYDGILAARIQMLGRQVVRKESRHFIGRFYATLANSFTGLPVHDSQCGCKVFRHSFYRKIADRLEERRFGFDLELLCEMHQAGARLLEVPVDWADIPGSKVSVVRDGFRMLASLLRLRARVKHRQKISCAVAQRA
jgi:glycosyltransferase involved in cell wall biosynthesis